MCRKSRRDDGIAGVGGEKKKVRLVKVIVLLLQMTLMC